jgi:hypothetical protein
MHELQWMPGDDPRSHPLNWHLDLPSDPVDDALDAVADRAIGLASALRQLSAALRTERRP